jgi:hypothetical protein
MMIRSFLLLIVCGALLAIGELSGSAAAEPNTPLPEFSQKDWHELGVIPVPEKKEVKTGFVVGGRNDTALITKLTSLNGRTIAELEKDMRPEANSPVGSSKGFLGKEENLLEVLAADNQLVVEEFKVTHQILARHLLALAAIGSKSPDKPFRYEGVQCKVTVQPSRGFQRSPFYDDTKTNTVVVVENLDVATKITYSLLVPQMIERYGFYEGTGTPYRLDPKQALKVLSFLKPSERKRW